MDIINKLKKKVDELCESGLMNYEFEFQLFAEAESLSKGEEKITLVVPMPGAVSDTGWKVVAFVTSDSYNIEHVEWIDIPIKLTTMPIDVSRIRNIATTFEQCFTLITSYGLRYLFGPLCEFILDPAHANESAVELMERVYESDQSVIIEACSSLHFSVYEPADLGSKRDCTLSILTPDLRSYAYLTYSELEKFKADNEIKVDPIISVEVEVGKALNTLVSLLEEDRLTQRILRLMVGTMYTQLSREYEVDLVRVVADERHSALLVEVWKGHNHCDRFSEPLLSTVKVPELLNYSTVTYVTDVEGIIGESNTDLSNLLDLLKQVSADGLHHVSVYDKGFVGTGRDLTIKPRNCRNSNNVVPVADASTLYILKGSALL